MNRVEKFFKKNINLLLVITLVLFIPRDLVFASGVESTILEIIHVVLTAIPGAFVYITGLLLNFSIDYLVIGMGQLITSTPGSTGEFIGINNAINSVWTLVRDILNIVFIFSLIYLGIKTILYSDDSSTRRSIGLLIIAALLINFSLFITKVIIDFSNVAALQIFNLINVTNAAESIGENRYYGVSGALLNILGVHTLMGAEDALEQFTGDGSFWAGISYIFMTAIFLLITAVVFAAGAFMLIARFVALIFYMIFSPVMFLGLILPNFKSTADRWWSGLLNKAFFAPAYLFTLYLSIYILKELVGGMNTSGGNNMANAITSANSGGPGAFEVILVFFLAAGMMIGSLIVAQKMGATGATSSLNFLKSAQKNIKGSLQNFAGRNTVGRFGNWMASSAEKNEATASGRWKNRLITAATAGAFDTQSRINAGKKMKSNTFGGSRSFESQEKWSSERENMQTKGKKHNDNIAAIKAGLNAPEGSQERIDMEKAIRKLDVKEAMKSEEGRKLLFNEVVAGKLSQKQITTVKDADTNDISDTNKGKLMGSRTNYVINKKLEFSDANLQNINKANKEDLKLFTYDQLQAGAKYLQDSQIEDLKKLVEEGNLTETEFSNIKQKREEDINNAKNDIDLVKDIIATRKSEKEITKLPKEFLESDNFIRALAANGPGDKYQLTVKLINQLVSSEANTKTIGNNIVNTLGIRRGQQGSEWGEWFGTPAGRNF